jgi:hypothetical protein
MHLTDDDWLLDPRLADAGLAFHQAAQACVQADEWSNDLTREWERLRDVTEMHRTMSRIMGLVEGPRERGESLGVLGHALTKTSDEFYLTLRTLNKVGSKVFDDQRVSRGDRSPSHYDRKKSLCIKRHSPPRDTQSSTPQKKYTPAKKVSPKDSLRDKGRSSRWSSPGACDISPEPLEFNDSPNKKTNAPSPPPQPTGRSPSPDGSIAAKLGLNTIRSPCHSSGGYRSPAPPPLETTDLCDVPAPLPPPPSPPPGSPSTTKPGSPGQPSPTGVHCHVVVG